MPKTVKQLQNELSKERYDVKNTPVQIYRERTGEYFDYGAVRLEGGKVLIVIDEPQPDTIADEVDIIESEN